MTIAQANAPVNDNGNFEVERIKARFEGDYPVTEPKNISLMDVAQIKLPQLPSLIPFWSTMMQIVLLWGLT